MRLFIFILFLLLNNSWAEVGRVLKVVGKNDAYLIRNKNKLPVSHNLTMEPGDQLFSQSTYLLVHLYPGTQMSLAKNTTVKISEHSIRQIKNLENVSSVIDLMKGIVRIQIPKGNNQDIDQRIQTEGVSIRLNSGDFEVSLAQNKDVDLDVFQGEAAVSSPFIHSFVPEIVKSNEGFRFEWNKKKFTRRKFSPKFKNHPGFKNLKEVKALREKKKKGSRT